MLKALPPAFLEAPHTQLDHISDLREDETVVPAHFGTFVNLELNPLNSLPLRIPSVVLRLILATSEIDFELSRSTSRDEIGVALSLSLYLLLATRWMDVVLSRSTFGTRSG